MAPMHLAGGKGLILESPQSSTRDGSRPEASAKTGALRRGVQRRETHRARSRSGTAALQRQGPERRGSRRVGPRGLASREKSVIRRCRVDEIAISCAQTAKAAYSPRKIVISGIQRVFDAPATGSIALH